ncbi:hypothetical protein [Cupriavidus basilensis]|nr:MAG TPA: head to tail adaptor [Caudoviricetes sp.]
MTTVQQVIDRGRVPLNDADKVRYPDATLLGYVNDGVAEVYALRPDLRFGKFGVALPDLLPGDTFPLSPQHAVAMQHYLVYRAEMKDDEHVNANREIKAYKLFQTLVSAT